MKYVVYKRVSTKAQSKSRLGLEGQENDLAKFIKANPGDVIGSFTEAESGTRKGKRIEIYKAIQLCKESGATLLIAKLDRLARDVSFIYNLKNGGVKFICCDMPTANEMTIGVLAVVAEAEAEFIKSRIKSALDAKRRRGERLGNDNVTKHQKKATLNSIKIRTELAKIKNHTATGIIFDMREAGKTYEVISNRLNFLNITTSKGKPFRPSTVYLLHKRAA